MVDTYAMKKNKRIIKGILKKREKLLKIAAAAKSLAYIYFLKKLLY
jgi:hypothetical protein